ncbi:hypothetical protein [Eggerthella sinensis]|uniref:hypothetical protein n=1 Tax=Eggerthella sinensis TaxID=242230 RepID=UPI001D07BADB|nr:hypothetical protein [Eggerthella sinensis]MCB7038336.1 hypothetical protein [Eggerthella sinensis]
MSSDKHKLKHKEKQQKKAQKHAKASAKASAAAVLGERTCPCCKKHCPLVKPKCSKGKAVRAKVLGDAGKDKDAGTGADKR